MFNKSIATSSRFLTKAASNRNFSSSHVNRLFMGGVSLPEVANEPMYNYEPNSPQRKQVLAECAKYLAPDYKPIEIPAIVNGKEIKTGHVAEQVMPSKHNTKLCTIYEADRATIHQAIKGSLEVKEKWENLPMEHKFAIFMKAADLLSSKYRYAVNAATMMGQAKNMWQAEIDSACELIDFWRFNANYALKIYQNQPEHHTKNVWNRLEYRALEGFVAAISPFNFTAIGGNLCGAPAQMGNVVLWKPSHTAVLSNYLVFQVLREAGLPDGVIQFLPSSPLEFSDVFLSKDLAGLHFTGSTATFNLLWKKFADNLQNYKSYPRIVGETGGKNFHLMHESADVTNFVYQTIRSAFEYQGQKCSACSRAYVPRSKWEQVRTLLLQEMKNVKLGQPNDPQTFVSAVIDKRSFTKISGYIERAKQNKNCEILYGGKADDKEGYFVEPTIILTRDAKSETMREEIFGPVLTIYVYDEPYEQVLSLVDSTTPYALTGAIFALDRSVIQDTLVKLKHSAGNVYVNDKSTGAVVGQQPFGGGRVSGTNDKAGSEFNLLRWTSARALKETFVSIPHWSYPSNQI